MLENVTVGEVVFTYAATDLDVNANLVYSLDSNKSSAHDENGRPVDSKKYIDNVRTLSEAYCYIW